MDERRKDEHVDVDSTVIAMIYDFPGLFRNRTQALHYLFAVVGNGYEWLDGELVESDVQTGEVTELERQLRWVLDGFDDRNYNPSTECLSIRQLAQIRSQMRGDLFAGGSMRFSQPEDGYPRSQYAHLLNVPESAKLDWVAAAEEIRPLIEASWATWQEARNSALMERA